MHNGNNSFSIEFGEQAIEEIKLLKKFEKASFNKFLKLLEELKEHPMIGTGRPEALKFTLFGYYSRRISQKHRLVYQIDNENLCVKIISLLGHYGEK